MHRKLQLWAILLPFAALGLPARSAAQATSPGYPAPPWQYAADSTLRIDVNPREARVYVDGYLAGQVEDFDGQTERLRLAAGQHELVIYLEGYRSLRQHLYLGPNTQRLVEGTLEPLRAGEPNEPEPTPASPPPASGANAPPPPPAAGRPPQSPSGESSQPSSAPRVSIGPDTPTRFAALSVRVTPGRSTLRVDDDQYQTAGRKEVLIVQVSEGHHVILVERKGYEPFRTEVDVDAGETLPLSITLNKVP